MRKLPQKVQKKSAKGVQSQKGSCAPAIWKKFSHLERLQWREFYEEFMVPMNFHADWEGKEFDEQREVTAHNLALQAVWSLRNIPSNLEVALGEMPDHFCRRGKKTAYELIITKNQKGEWIIAYENYFQDPSPIGSRGVQMYSYSEGKAYDSLLEAIQNCKKYLTTRQWKK